MDNSQFLHVKAAAFSAT